MFNSNVAIVDGEITTNYGLISIVGSQSQRSNAAAVLGQPDVFSISHETKGKGAAAVDRHLVRIDKTYQVTNPDGSITKATASVYVVLVAPQSVVTASNVEEVYRRVTSFLGATENGASSSNIQRILNNEP